MSQHPKICPECSTPYHAAATFCQLDGSALVEQEVSNDPLVGARLPSETFESRHARYHWHDGMRGRAEVRVKTTTMLEALIPALEELR